MENLENTSFFQTTTAKMIMVGLLTLVLLVPLQYVKSLIEERSKRQKEVVTEINQKWGESIFFYGPIIKVPYSKSNIIINQNNGKSTVTTEEVSEDNFIYFFPNNLKNAATVTMKKPLKRNNYESIVFTSEIEIQRQLSNKRFETKQYSGGKYYVEQSLNYY